MSLKKNPIKTVSALYFFLVAGVSPSVASIIYFDYRPPAPAVTDSAVAGKNSGTITGGVFLSPSGASASSGELKIDLSAYSHGQSYLANVKLNSGLAIAANGDLVTVSSSFPSTATTLLSINGSGSQTYNGYVKTRFNAGAGNYYFGWAEIETSVVATSRNSVRAEATILRMAFNNTANESIIVGAIPEPSVHLLILTGGGIVFVGHRWRTHAKGKQEKTS